MHIVPRRLVQCCVSLGLLVAIVPDRPAAATATVEHLLTTGQSAHAFFHAVDSTGCVITDVFIVIGNSVVRDGNGNAVGSLASVDIDRYDVCRGLFLYQGIGSTSTFQFSMDSKLSQARFTGTIPCFEFISSTPLTAIIDLTWVANGDVTHDAVATHFGSPPGFVINSIFVGDIRPARAQGTVSDGTTQFLIGPTSDAEMDLSKTGDITVQRN